MTNEPDNFRDDFNLGDPKPKDVAAEPNREGWGIFPDFDLEAYYADPCPDPSLSNSGMSYLLAETPLDFAYQHPRLNPDAERLEATVAQRRGDVVHQLALGKGRGYAVADFADWRTKDAKAFRDNAIADGLTPIKRADFEEAEIMAGVIRQRIKEVLDGADYQTEVAFMYQEETAAGPIWVRGLMDVWCPELGVILDPKVTPQLYDEAIGRHMINMGWDRQAALYSHAVGKIMPELAGRVRFADLMVKPKAPFTSRVVSIEKAWYYSAVKQCERAFEIFGRCLYEGRWPGFGSQVEHIPCPPWEAKRREQEETGEV